MKADGFGTGAPILALCVVLIGMGMGCGRTRRYEDSRDGASSGQQVKRIDPERMAAEMTTHMADRLGLDEAQTRRVESVNLRHAREMSHVLATAGSRRSKLSAIREMQARKDVEIKGILTEGQYRAYLALKEEFKQKMRQRMQQRR